jgi:hypothetical protein
MSMGGRATARSRILRRAAIVAGVLVLLTLLFLLSGHWLLAIIFGVAAALALWAYTQARRVR